MKTTYAFLALSIAGLAAAGCAADTMQPPGEELGTAASAEHDTATPEELADNEEPALGQGFNSVPRELRGQCVTGTSTKGAPSGNQVGQIGVVAELSEAQASSMIKVSTDAKVKYGVWDASAKLSMQRETKESK